MRAGMRIAILALISSAVAASDATAALGWLEKLSGPGPFVGVMVPVSFLCYGEDLGQGASATANASSREQEPAPAERDANLGLFVNNDCLDANLRKPRVSFTLQVGQLWSLDNTLPYEGVPPGQEPGVRILMIVPAISTPVMRFLDVGAGLGVARFSGEDDAFDAFWRAAVQPVRVTVRPLSFFRTGYRWEALEMRMNATVFTGRFTAADFGATGSFNERGELLWERIIYVDVLKLFSTAERRSR